ncbi:MAG: peptidylprolyl isomerase [Desulfobacterales bacterium]|nr:peptidylprolyl isomerase [Deltaproteobacteria bacterium]NNK95237.1 peptidylprolyl isomerase [Desulfobacterales bacterium]
MTIKQGDTVKVHYTGTLEDGEIFDSSQGKPPLSFTIGSGKVIPGFNDAVIGMEVGETKDVTIPAERAYGERKDELVIIAPVEQIPPGLKPEIGQMLEVGGASGDILKMRVVELDEKNITLDANPPLAGQNLTFQIELVERN